jgi:patatin-like phospholipase/acyl hydrolase
MKNMLTMSRADGGGIRGLSSLYILENMMQKIKLMENYDVQPLPCNYFDMICSTSIGGYI